MANDRLFNHSQGTEMIKALQGIYNIQKQAAAAEGDTTLSSLEMQLAEQFIAGRDDKVFATKFYKYSTNSTAAGEKLLDSVGLIAEPSTDTVEGRDDFLEASQIFQWQHCNYVRDDDSTARVTQLEGMPGYRTSGAVDVGALSPTFWWGVEDHGSCYVVYMASKPHPELGLVPWIEAVKTDGTILPYYIDSSYASVMVDSKPYTIPDGIPTSGNVSHDANVTLYQKKGAGYWGAGVSRTTVGYLFYLIKYANKSSQVNFAGCTDFNRQPKVAYAESDVKRVLVPTSETKMYAGMCVSVSDTSFTSAPDRNNSKAHTTVNRAKVTSVETVTVDGTNYLALNLDIDTAITTDTAMYVSAMPCFTGETDAVIGIKDGSYLSNTNGAHTYRIKGIEYNWGQWVVYSDAVMEYEETDTERAIYIAPKGVAHVAGSHANHVKIGNVPSGNGDLWIGDMAFDKSTGAMYPASVGGGDRVGCGDRLYKNAGAKGSMREVLGLASLSHGSYAGLCHVLLASGMGHAYWAISAAD